MSPLTAACQSPLSFTIYWSLLKPIQPSHLCCPLLLSSIFPSIRVFSNESPLHIRRPNYWSYSFSISLSNEYSGLISFSIDGFDLLAVQETLKSLLQYHSLKASFLWRSTFLTVQLLYLESPSTVILEHKKLKSVTVSIVSPSICH